MIIKFSGIFFITLILVVLSYYYGGLNHTPILLGTLWIYYLVIVLSITTFGRLQENQIRYELIPFGAYLTLMNVGWYGWGIYIFYGLVGNILLFVPTGMLIVQIPVIKHKYLISGIIGFALSLSIEITQYYTLLGTFEVDDLIHNTWGAVIGCAIALALMKKEKSIKANIRSLMPLIVFVVLIGIASVLSIGRDLLSRL